MMSVDLENVDQKRESLLGKTVQDRQALRALLTVGRGHGT